MVTLRMLSVLFIAMELRRTALAASSVCTEGTEYEPPLCSFKMPAIQSVTIEQNVAKSSVETDPGVDCSGFKVDERFVRRYFARAKLVPPEEGHHRLDWSACYAAGKFRLKNGQSASWYISQTKVGALSVNGQAQHRLYCPTCKDKPLTW
jgi:hypothetical protein